MAEPDYPNTADGDALRRIASRGNDMDRPMVIDFHVTAPTEAIADQCLARIRSRDFDAEKYAGEAGENWTVEIPVEMIPDYEEIIFFQKVLDEDLAEFGARSDGWGTFSNVRTPDKDGDGQ